MNLEITSTSITVQAREIVNANTVNYAWNFIEGQSPQLINFNVQRGVSGGDNPQCNLRSILPRYRQV